MIKCAEYLLGECRHFFGIGFCFSSVVCENAVCFILNVADLCQHGGAKTALDRGNYLLAVKLKQSRLKLIRGLEKSVSVGV